MSDTDLKQYVAGEDDDSDDLPPLDDFLFDFGLEEEQAPVHTGQDLSPFGRYFSDLRWKANSQGKNVELPPAGPVLQVGRSILQDLRSERRIKVAQKRHAQEERRRVAEQERDDELRELQEEVKREASELWAKKDATRKYMIARTKRIKKMRWHNGQIKGVGAHPAYRDHERPWMLDVIAWDRINKTQEYEKLGFRAGKETWEDYIANVVRWQQQLNNLYKRWFLYHVKLPKVAMWVDETATYKVRNRHRKYREEMIEGITYHWGVPHFHVPRAPRFIPRPPPKPKNAEPLVCFQCEAKNLRLQCHLMPGGCSRCKRTGEECMSLDIWDIKDARRGKMEMEDVRAWFAGVTPKCLDEDDPDFATKFEAETKKRRKWFDEGRFEHMEWVGGEKGFVVRNTKKDSWGLPKWERDDEGKIVPIES